MIFLRLTLQVLQQTISDFTPILISCLSLSFLFCGCLSLLLFFCGHIICRVVIVCINARALALSSLLLLVLIHRHIMSLFVSTLFVPLH